MTLIPCFIRGNCNKIILCECTYIYVNIHTCIYVHIYGYVKLIKLQISMCHFQACLELIKSLTYPSSFFKLIPSSSLLLFLIHTNCDLLITPTFRFLACPHQRQFLHCLILQFLHSKPTHTGRFKVKIHQWLRMP